MKALLTHEATSHAGVGGTQARGRVQTVRQRKQFVMEVRGTVGTRGEEGERGLCMAGFSSRYAEAVC